MRIFSRRALLIGGAQMLLFSLLAGRIYYLQILKGGNYRRMAEDNRINLRMVLPPRGKILDRFGTPLAVNDQTFRAVLLPEQISDTKSLNALIEEISQFVFLTKEEKQRIDRDMRERRSFNAILIKDNLSRDQMDRIAAHTPDLIGVDIDAGEIRTYPYGETTAHVLGYVGSVSRDDIDDAREEENEVLMTPGFHIGKNGIEKQYEKAMRGQMGDVEMEVNAHGRVVRELVRHDPIPGRDIALTLDIGLQQFTQKRVAAEEGASAVLMDIFTGDILALVSHPSFDPNLFTFGISNKDWLRLNRDIHAPLLNKAIGGTYAPGSTFKIITALAALDADVVSPKEKVFCPGHYELGEHVFHCWKSSGHGYVNLIDALAYSCDTYFYEVGKRVGIDKIRAMAQRFGFGEKVGLDLPHERSGFVPSRAWKKTSRHQEWQQGETLIAAIGQGFVLASPLQLAVMTARLANNGRAVFPHLVQKIGEESLTQKEWEDMGLNPDHIALVRRGMAAVVNREHGTASGAAISQRGMEMAGKTGSAQVRRISKAERLSGVIRNEDLPWRERDHALFVGYAPVSKPRYAVSVVVEHGGSGAHKAAPIARDILWECQKRYSS
ncbi:MAG: penicillin-binding protein 2 [Alphaproteobacteria bacterium]|nr:penicillin-binding protein 2 [Alphaproteobacteria bacterium]